MRLIVKEDVDDSDDEWKIEDKLLLIMLYCNKGSLLLLVKVCVAGITFFSMGTVDDCLQKMVE